MNKIPRILFAFAIILTVIAPSQISLYGTTDRKNENGYTDTPVNLNIDKLFHLNFLSYNGQAGTPTTSGFNPASPLSRFNLSYKLPPYVPVKKGVRIFVKDQKLKALFDPRAFQLTLPDLTQRLPKKRFGRALLEGVAHFAYATSSYWIRQEVMREDWEYQFTWKDQKRRFLFLDGPRFDSNTFQFNWTHSGAGAIYYNYARTNRLNSLESFLYGLGMSTFWEFVVEFREVVSINDMIGTPMGGLSIGEATYQVSRVFRDSKPTLVTQLASFLSNPIMSLNNWLDRKKNEPKLQDGASQLWRDFRFYTGPGTTRFSGEKTLGLVNMGLEAQVIVLPEYRKPGYYSRYSKGTLFSQYNVGLTMDNKGIREFNLFAKSVLFGYFNQYIRPANENVAPRKKDDIRKPDDADEPNQDNNIDETNDGDDFVRGYSFFLGVASGFDLSIQSASVATEDETIPYKTDKLCVINLLGPAWDLAVYHKKLKIRWQGDAFVNFSLVHSTSFQQYNDLYPVENTKSTLQNHAYYYALGLTANSSLQFQIANLELTGRMTYYYFNSVEGLDRFQKDMADEDDLPLEDKRLNLAVSLGYTIPGSNLQLMFTLESIRRQGWVKDFYRKHTESRSYFQFKYLF